MSFRAVVAIATVLALLLFVVAVSKLIGAIFEANQVWAITMIASGLVGFVGLALLGVIKVKEVKRGRPF